MAPAAVDRDSPGREVLLLTSADLAGGVPLTLVIDAVERAYRLAGEGALAQVPRVPVRESGTRTFLHLLGALSGAAGLAGAHVYTGGNRGAGAVQKLTLVFRTSDGGLRAVIESDWLSWARTGATGAVATRHLAPADAAVLGVIGSGRQARAQVHAIAATRRLERVLVYSPDQEHRRAFAREVGAEVGVEVEPVADAGAVVRRAGVVSTATTARTPVFEAGAVQPGLHVNAIGAHYPDRRELDGATLARARVFADDPERSALEDGELALAGAEGALPAGVPVGSLARVVAGREPGRTAPDEVTVFLSGGLGSEYLLAAAAVADEADRLGLGTRIRL